MRDQTLQPREVRPAPIDTPALPALLERAKAPIDARRHQLVHSLPCHCRLGRPLHVMQRVKGRNARFSCSASTISSTCRSGSRERSHCPLHDRLALEQAHVTRQQDASFTRRELGELGVVEIVAVERVEPKKTQVTCERAEVDVCHEAGSRSGLGRRRWIGVMSKRSNSG